ncbi:MAG: 6-phosphofructokinase [Pseudomonadota bacterium]|nr:6-phosphofructokinase [Pseudomonadota bacterium]
MVNKNIFFAHSGGVTATINTTLSGVLTEYKKNKDFFDQMFIGCNGIIGAIEEELIDVSHWDQKTINTVRMTPGSIFGSCRFKLKDPSKQESEFARILDVFKAHNIGYFIYNGGNDSQDTTLKISEYCKANGHPLVCIGIPKTIDNDLEGTDHSPGFGSAAKYLATSMFEASIDLASMSKTSTKVFVLEVMGRNAGWLAASTALAPKPYNADIILMPERAFNQKATFERIQSTVATKGYCSITVAEGLKNDKKNIWSLQKENIDAFGHTQLGGVGSQLSQLIQKELKLKTHFAIADYLQRSARHIASKVDSDESFALGQEAIKFCKARKSGKMLTIERLCNHPYRSRIKDTYLENVANKEKLIPDHFIQADGLNVNDMCIEYLKPLIVGEDYPNYYAGLPNYKNFKKNLVKKQLDVITQL